MPNFKVLEPAIDPNNRISFLLDWEITMKCNLDCSYCPTGLYSGHDNSTQHPPLADCIKTIDFLFEYADIYLSKKPKGLKYVILNVYGGESLHHPNIVDILEACHKKYKEKYQDRWHLTITTTTNAIINHRKIFKIIPLIDEFTCSYHTESSKKQKETFTKNVLEIKNAGKRVKVVVLMHSETELFDDAIEMIEWCKAHNIKNLPRQLDYILTPTKFNYNSKQIKWFDSLYKNKSYKISEDIAPVPVLDKFNLTDTGRACCGGRQLCKDFNRRQRIFFVENKFRDWYCSVNEFFLYVKQVNGEIYVNKDCKMNFDNKVGPIGHLSDVDELLKWTKNNLENKTMPVIRCKKDICICGVCAPKSETLDNFNKVMRIYQL